MGQAEGPIEAYLTDEVKRLGGQQRKVQWIGRYGAPDRLVWWSGPRFGFIEVKSAKGRYEASQKREIKRMREDGWPVYTVRSRADVDSVLLIIRACEIL